MEKSIIIRKAKIKEVVKIKELIDKNVKEAKMIPRSYSYLYENLRDFFVAVERKTQIVVGCVALHIIWEDLAEVKSLAVEKEYRKSGIGARLVKACIKEAKELGLKKVFALTAVPDFFKKMGFYLISKGELPHKIWADCINCPFFPDKCYEEAVIIDISNQ